MRVTALLCSLLVAALRMHGETGEAAWLRYAPIEDANVAHIYEGLPAAVVTLDSVPPAATAQSELLRGVHDMLGRTMRIEEQLGPYDCVLLGSFAAVRSVAPEILLPQQLVDDSYLLKMTAVRGHRVLLVTAPNGRGVLYGTFALLRKIALHEEISDLDEMQSPQAPIRWTNEWNNLNGSIERGYAGRSIFFADGNVVADLRRAGEYARLLASLGINGCTVNNVNADMRVLTPEFIGQLVRIADAFRPWGVRLSIAVDFSSPKAVGHLETFDPLDPKVGAWWKAKTDELYRAIPDLAGILLKADSEGRVGPSTYGRTHADAANVIARALKPHGGVLVYRGFVYDHHMDWRNLKNDRARAAYDNFAKLDGQFDNNVLVQIKYGPIDFQVREPVSPLFGVLTRTNETIEFQVTQEYTGQQRHLCFLLPMWKEILDFDMRTDHQPSTVKTIVSGKRFSRPTGGFVAVSNVGLDQNWLGNDLAMANLYAFGRIAWNAELDSRQVIDEWTRLTFGDNRQVVETVDNLQLRSWRVYEQYTGPLGAGGLTDIIGVHFGPGIESSERNGWGQWHRADHDGIGMDRTVATGTGYTGQYPNEVASQYESLKTVPDDLLLFLHHVRYDYFLHSGKTLIQHIYDSHYDGATEAQTYPDQWRRLHGLIDEDRYAAVLQRLNFQAGHAVVWRDAVCKWFQQTSGIPDSAGRVGQYPERIEAESMQLNGYVRTKVIPWETASGGLAVACSDPSGCTVETTFGKHAGWYDVSVGYFAPNVGDAQYELALNGHAIGTWRPELPLPSNKLNGHTSVRYTVPRVALRSGDKFTIAGRGSGANPAAIDYLEVRPTR